MSFFGFDTSLPRDRGRDREMEAEDVGLGASAQEDVEVYTWGEEAYDDLADRLQEDGDDFNQDTFGEVEIDNNFDFAAQSSNLQPQSGGGGGKNEDKFKSNNLNDFWGAPSNDIDFGGSNSGLGKSTSQSYDPFGGVSLAPVPGLAPPPPSSSFAQFGNQSSQSRPPLTLEEVEAELRASRSQQQQQGPAPVTSGSDGRRALTLEEVEAQMLAQRSSQPPQLPPQQPAFNDFPPPPPQFQGLPPHISALLAQQPPNLSPQQREQLLGIQLQQLQQSGILGAGGPIGMANEGMGMGINGSAPTVQGGIQAPPPSSSEIRGSPAPQAQAPIPQQPSQRVGTPKSQQHKAQQSSSGGVGGILSNPSHFPPLGSNAPPTGPNLNSGRDAPPISNPLQQLMNGSAQAVQNRNGPMMGIGGLPLAPNQNQMNNLSNASANAALLQAQAAQEQNLRMRNLLNSLPKVLQSRLLNQIPPYVQFETLDLLVRNLPLLVGLTFDEEEEKLLNLQNELKEGKSLKEELEEKLLEGNREEIERFRIEGVLKKMEMLDNANRLVDSILKREDMRRKIAAKIQGMSRYNNLMTTSDKDFITRIQVSQLVTPDPYADDFYAHIYFALRGGGPGAAVAAASAGITSGNKSEQSNQNNDPPKGPRRGRQRGGAKVKETAMQRMQAQVERLVANRKARDGERESASLAAAAGATTAGSSGGAPSSDDVKEKDSSSSIGKGNTSTPSSPAVSNLGKVTSASSKNPRQLLQISAREVREERLKREGKLGEEAGGVTDGSATEAVRAALAGASLGEGAGRAELSNGGKREPLTRFETLRILEKLYDTVLALEQMRRSIPQAPLQIQPLQGETNDQNQEEQEKYQKQLSEWQTEQETLVTALWKELRILEPLEISNPHPFVSLLNTSKGKRLFPRALRHLSPEQVLTSLTMIVCNFGSLDVVKLSGYLDLSEGINGSNLNDKQKSMRMEARRQTEAFAGSIIPVMLSELVNAPMRIVCGMLALFIDQHDILRVAKSKPGIALLTMFLSRGELLRQGGSAASGVPNPTPEELDQWVQVFSLLFARLSGKEGSLVSLFPSTRIKDSLPFGQAAYYSSSLSLDSQRNIDLEDEPVWNLMATLAISASMEQQHTLVQQLREKILENVVAAKRERENVGLNNDLGNEGNDLRIRNVNLLLHALNLDASQITA